MIAVCMAWWVNRHMPVVYMPWRITRAIVQGVEETIYFGQHSDFVVQNLVTRQTATV